MVNVNLLKKKIAEIGIPIVVLAEKSGISRETLYNRFEKPNSFKASEIHSLTMILGMTKDERDNIFFANNSECNSQKDIELKQ